MIIQCDSGDKNSDLIACARYNIWNEYTQSKQEDEAPIIQTEESIVAIQEAALKTKNDFGKCHIVFIIQLPRVAGGCFVGFQGGKWLSVHIDDLRPQKDKVSILTLKNKSVSSLFEEAILADSPEARHVETAGLEQGWSEYLLHEALREEGGEDPVMTFGQTNEDDGMDIDMGQVCYFSVSHCKSSYGKSFNNSALFLPFFGEKTSRMLILLTYKHTMILVVIFGFVYKI